MILKAMVMAAGVGSRLDPLTQEIPKPLIPIANRPIMDIILERLAEYAITDVISNTHYLADKIIERYKKNSLNVNFNYVHEKELSGTAGGVKKCQHFFEEGEDFIVLSADGLTNVDLKKAIDSHKTSGAIVTMGIKKIAMKDIPNFGVVVINENHEVVEFQEKPTIEEAKSDCINTGIYVFNYEIFNHIPADTFYDFARNVFPKLLEQKLKINTFIVDEYWSDIGTIEQYQQSTKDVFEKLCSFKHDEVISTELGTYITGKSHISESAKLRGFNTIGENCIIGKNVILEDCIIWDDVEIKENTKLTNCIVASHCEINTDLYNQTIGPNQIVNKGVYK